MSKKAKKGQPGRPKNGATGVRLTIIFKEPHLKYFNTIHAELEEERGSRVTKTEIFEYVLESMKDFKKKSKE